MVLDVYDPFFPFITNKVRPNKVGQAFFCEDSVLRISNNPDPKP